MKVTVSKKNTVSKATDEPNYSVSASQHDQEKYILTAHNNVKY